VLEFAALDLFTKQIEIRHGDARARLARQQMRHRFFDLLSGHARGQHRQRVAQIYHVVDARAGKIVCGRAGKLHRELPEIAHTRM
jgi:hypothetical protein